MKGVIFDMDGILIDSEPFWRRAEMEVFGNVGCPLTEDDCRRTTGLSVIEVVKYWDERRGFSQKMSHNTIAQQIRAGVIRQVEESGEAKPGILAALQKLSAQGIPIGLASGSEYQIITAVVDKLGIREYFQAIVSTEEFPLGKPHPAVYLEACSRLALPSTTVVAIEDSVNGMVAAKAARMLCVVIPELHGSIDPRFRLADAILSSAEELSDGLWESLSATLR